MTAIERIAEARAAALGSLSRAAAGDSLCTLDRERMPAAKYHEGAVAALGDALRAARRDLPEPSAEHWGEEWSARAEHWGEEWSARAEGDVAWRAYLAGGRDALRALAPAPAAR